MKPTQKILALILFLVLTLNLASAVIINSVDAETLSPGKEGTIRIEVKNILDNDVKEISLVLDFKNLPFIPIGTSEQSTDEIRDGDEENFVFKLKAAQNIVPGDYEIPYSLKYTPDFSDAREVTRTGSIGISVRANPVLVPTLSTENPVESQQGKITVRIVNKGFSDARFVSVKILPDKITILSDSEVYIGTIDSDDFETASFDVLFRSTDAHFNAVIEYRDFDNKQVLSTINLPVTVYTQAEAKELGIIKPNYTVIYITAAIIIIVVFLIWRSIRKRQRLRRSAKNREEKK